MSDILCLDGAWRLYLAPHAKTRALPSLPVTAAALAASGFTSLEGSVPGNFEIDMMRRGMLPDLYFGENTLRAQRLENLHLFYVRSFEWDGSDACLRFDGIDTVAEIYLNGEKIAETDNMFIPHTIPAHATRRGENELCVHILPAAIAARERELEPYAAVALAYNYGSLAVRKAAHMYGWDIFPRIVSGGLWKSVYVTSPKAEEIADLYLYTPRVSRESAEICVYYRARIEGDFSQDYTLRVTGRAGASSFSRDIRLWHTEGTARIRLEHPALWWPRDLGEAALYDVTAELLLDGRVIDEKQTTLGVRTVSLEYTDVIEDDGSGRFCFSVNGERVFIRGTNWVPLDAFHSQDAGRLPMACALLERSGSNMIRVWGGGVYESDELYDWCDRHGVLVWQDFMMGCASYPQTDEFAAALAAEARAVIERLRRHPSLALWAGDNECDCAIAHWGASPRDPGDNRLTRAILPDAVRRYDPARQFLPSSPYISPRAYREHKRTPEDHLWGPRDYYKGPYYTGARAVFASETGYHGCPSPSSLRRFLPKDALWPWENNPVWLVHASCMEARTDTPYSYRIPLMANQVKTLFGEIPQTLSEFSAASQISQAEAMKFFLERFRGAKWERTGIIWWNLLDGWPQFSDAVVDYYGGEKLAFHVLARCQQPTLLMLGEADADGRHPVIFVNDGGADVHAGCTVTDADTGETVFSATADAKRNSAASVIGSIEAPGAARCLLLSWRVDGTEYRSHYLTGKPPYRLGDAIRWMRAAGFDFEEV